jgi:hypothetical protein
MRTGSVGRGSQVSLGFLAYQPFLLFRLLSSPSISFIATLPELYPSGFPAYLPSFTCPANCPRNDLCLACFLLSLPIALPVALEIALLVNVTVLYHLH